MESKNYQDNLLQNCNINHEFCVENNKLLRNHIELLSNSIEEIIHIVSECRNQQEKIKECEAKEIEHQMELANKNNHIKQLQMDISIYNGSLEVVPKERRNEQLIIEQLSKNLCEKENTEIAQIQAKSRSVDESLAKCETKLTREKNTIVAKDQQINELQTHVKALLDKKNAKSCIAVDTNGLKTVSLTKGNNFVVRCNSDIAGTGWTVIQQRINGREDFFMNWETYRNGFGDLSNGDFFLGLEKIHRLTTEQPHELYIHMEKFDGSTTFARYDEFGISGEDDQYRLSKLGKFSGSATNELRNNKNNRFSTYDRDNDDSIWNCAEYYHSGWWFNDHAHW